MINLNDLLAGERIDPAAVIVMRHRPAEASLNKVFAWLAAERPDLFNAYQQTYKEVVEKALAGAAYIASFIRHGPGRALFIGLYSIGSSKPLSLEQFWQVPAFAELRDRYGMLGFRAEEGRDFILSYELSLTEFYATWKGKLIVSWPPPERSWWRWANRNVMKVDAVLEESARVGAMPPWENITLSWEELSVLPSRWRDALSHWRGVYLIQDTTDGRSYVGSAYGDQNILGRWVNYASSGHGGNQLLRQRNPRGFRFAILQRVSPDMEPADVIRLENTWKVRLGTRDPVGLNVN